MKKIYLLILTFSILTFSCKKDLNFEKFDKISISPEFGVPLAIVEMKMSDIFKQDSNIVYDPNGFISFIQRQDSVASFPVDSFVTLPSIDPLETDNKLGVLDIDNLTINQSKSLDEMSSNFSTSTKNALTLVAGQVAIFPAITDENSELNNLPINSSQFESISLSEGFMVLEFRNELPVTIDQIRINIYNTSPFQYFISQLVFNNVAPNSSKKDSINLNNVTLSNGLGYSLPVFKTFASSSPVLVDLDDQIKFNIETKGLKAYAGAAIFPTKSIDPQS
ncbi:MAG: hypothetical protein K9H61_03420, partial [Bacteroidia bacterium]|nr:hypothetical protein [Bacteroidia bacterium]